MQCSGVLHALYVVFLCILLLGSCASPGSAPEPTETFAGPPDRSRITAITTMLTATAQVVTIQSTTPLRYTAFQLSDPLRLVLDFVDATFAPAIKPLIVEEGVIRAVNPVALEKEGIARVEIDLQQETPHKIVQQAGQLTVSLTPLPTLPATVSGPAGMRKVEQEPQIVEKPRKQEADVSTPYPGKPDSETTVTKAEKIGALQPQAVKPHGTEVPVSSSTAEKPLPLPATLTVGEVLPAMEGKAQILQGIQVEKGEEFTRVRLFADGKIGAYNVVRREAASQLLVSLPEMRMHLPQQEITIDSPFLEKVSITGGERGEELLLVFTVPTPARYKISREQNQLVLNLSPATALETMSSLAVQAAQTAAPSPEAVLLPSAVQVASAAKEPVVSQARETPYTVQNISVQKLPDKTAIRVETTSPAPQYVVSLREDPLRLSLDLENALLSKAQHQIIDVDPASGGAVQSVIPLQYAETTPPATKIVVRLITRVPYQVTRVEGGILLEIVDPPQLPALAQGQKPTEQPKPGPPEQQTEAKAEEQLERQYTGTRISLDFQRADINDILRLLAEVSGFNIITGGDVRGEVSIRMVNVPWDQALDVILRANGLGQERLGNIIRVAPRERLFREQQEELQSRQAKVSAEEPVTQIIPVKYADAKELQPNLQSLLSQRGTINIDQRTNTIIVRDVKDNIQQVFALIATLDKQTPQVLIEARIVETSRTFTQQFGIQWGGLLSSTTDFRFPRTIGITGGRGNASTGIANPPPGPPATTAPTTQDERGTFVVNLPAAVGPGAGGALGITLGHLNNSALLDIQISALEDTGQGRVISSPRVATLDNKEAKIESGFTIPFETTSAEGTRTEFVDANINLTVTPHVTPDDFVIMQIRAARNEPDFSNRSAGGAPTIVRREATTNVLVRDGETTVIGGLFQQNLSNAVNGIPYLSRIPVLGWLFKRQSRQDNNNELLIFITPRILRERTTPSPAASRS